MENNQEYKSQITIQCKDNSIRVITVIGLYNTERAISLSRDLEGDNYYSCSVKPI